MTKWQCSFADIAQFAKDMGYECIADNEIETLQKAQMLIKKANMPEEMELLVCIAHQPTGFTRSYLQHRFADMESYTRVVVSVGQIIKANSFSDLCSTYQNDKCFYSNFLMDVLRKVYFIKEKRVLQWENGILWQTA